MLKIDIQSTWPPQIVDELNNQNVIDLCKDHNYIDHIADHPDILHIFRRVEDYVKKSDVIGYHCTKELPTKPFLETGLRTLSFPLHHEDFRSIVKTHKDVDENLYQHIDSELSNWENNHTGFRENQLWFCMTRDLVLQSGTDKFFQYYGGEAVYLPFLNDEQVKPILESVGEPVVVEVKISNSNFTVFKEWAFGRELVSCFAITHNPDFFIEGLEGYVCENISPEEIIAVHPYDEFVRSIIDN